jgi:hypothetical protein
VLATWQSDEPWAKSNKLLKAGFSDPEDKEHVLGPTIYDWLSSIIDPSFFRKKGVAKETANQIQKDDEALKRHHNVNSYNDETDARQKSFKQSHTKDLLSRGKIALNSESMGLLAMDRQDPKTDGTPLALLEFRSVIGPEVSEGLDVARWLGLAETLFTLARHHNKLKP